jgi:hypothetical protein
MSLSPTYQSKPFKSFEHHLLIKEKKEKRSNSINIENDISLIKEFNKNDSKIYNEKYVVLNYIIDVQKRFSTSTALTDTKPETFKYDLTMINKYEEDLNTSLDYISDFDLEKDDNDKNSSFESENDNNDSSDVEIKIKNNKKFVIKKK